MIFLQIRHRIRAESILGSSNIGAEHLQRLRRVAGYMVLYPIAYVVLSLPLAAGRMATMQGNAPSRIYMCIAGAIMASSGFVDVLLYTLTRRNLLTFSDESSTSSSTNRRISTVSVNTLKRLSKSTTGPMTSNMNIYNRRPSSTRSLSGHLHKISHLDRVDETDLDDYTLNVDKPSDSDTELIPADKVYQETTIEVVSEPAPTYPVQGREQVQDQEQGQEKEEEKEQEVQVHNDDNHGTAAGTPHQSRHHYRSSRTQYPFRRELSIRRDHKY